MSNCRTLCITCSSEQQFKVNFIKIHGVCPDHLDLKEFVYCIHCKSTVPVIFSVLSEKSETFKGKQVSNNLTHSTFSSSQTISFQIQLKLCDYCTKPSENLISSCHKICNDCFSVQNNCPICNIETSQIESCCYCQAFTEIDKKNCGHSLCDDCFKGSCPLCLMIERPESLYSNSIKYCDYCHAFETLSRCPEDQHDVCSSCFEEGCRLCLTYSTPRNRCMACFVFVVIGTCSRGHALCEKCLELCTICNANFSVTKDEFIVDFSTGSTWSTGKSNLDTRLGSRKEERKDSREFRNEMKNETQGKIGHDGKVSESLEGKKVKKKVIKGEAACNNCLIFCGGVNFHDFR